MGSVLGEYWRMKRDDCPLNETQFLANFLMSVFATFMIVLYFFEDLDGLLKKIGFSGFVSIQDYNLVNIIINKIINLKISFKGNEGDKDD